MKQGTDKEMQRRYFNLSKTTVNKWHVRYKSEGRFYPRKLEGAKPRIDIERFIKYVEENPNARAEDTGKVFGMSGAGARYWLKKLGFSYKKSV